MELKKEFGTIIVFLIVVITSNAQGNKYGATPADSVECIKNLSVYKDPYFKSGDYQKALGYWRKACKVCPKSQESLYINGGKMYEKFIEDEKDGPTAEKYVDTLFMLYDRRIENFGREGYVLGRKGAIMMKYRGKKTEDIKAAYEVLKKSFELQGNKAEAAAIASYGQAIFLLIKQNELTCETMIAAYPEMSAVITYNIKNQKREQKVKVYKIVQENLDKMFSPCASCEDLVRIFSPKFESNPDDVDQMKLIMKILNYSKCVEEKLYKNVAERLFEKEPSAESAVNIGNLFVKDNNCSKAIEYYKKAAEQADDNDMKIDAYIKAAKCYNKIGQYSSSRTYAQKALGVNPNYGEAYIVIGDAYAASVNDCGEGECLSKSVYWAAVDKYKKAKAVDPSVTSVANSKISAYTAQFPKTSDCFFNGLNEGDSYTVGCWINEETIVRVQ